ncbi:MAG TPA: caspase family protein, partial [Chthonomonadaceae bacterium]|nr:caspase family protein [Chthonomonadaceae bacterium]
MWNLATGQRIGHAPAPVVVSQSVFSDDGKYLACAGNNADAAITVWEVAAKKAVCELDPYDANQYRDAVGLVFRPNSHELAATYNTGDIHFWDVDTQKSLGELPKTDAKELAYSRDGAVFATCGNALDVYDARTHTRLATLRGYAVPVSTLAFRPDGKALAAGSGQMAMWELSTGRRSLLTPDEDATDIGFDTAPGAGFTFVMCTAAGAVKVWDAAAGDAGRVLAKVPPATLAVARYGRTILVGYGNPLVGLDGTDAKSRPPTIGGCQILDAADGKLIAQAQVKTDAVSCIAIRPGGKQAALVTADGHVSLIDTRSGHLIRQIDPLAPALSITYSRDGKRLLANFGVFLQIFDPDTGDGPEVFRPPENSGSGLMWFAGAIGLRHSAADISPDGKSVVMGMGETVLIIDRKTGAMRRLAGHEAEVTHVLFSPDGSRIASAAIDGTIRLWDVKSGKQIVMMAGTETGDYVTATPDGYYTASRGALRSVGFRFGDRVYPFDQWDAQLNRPDRVLAALGTDDPALREAYLAIRLKRLRLLKLGAADGGEFRLPELRITQPPPTTTDQRAIRIPIDASDAGGFLARLNVAIDDVPIRFQFDGAQGAGAAGLDLGARHSRTLKGEVSVQLSSGGNHIQIWVTNAAGVASLREEFAIGCTAPAARSLYVFTVGVTEYDQPRYNLKFARKDAEDLAAFFGAHGGNFAAVRTRTIPDKEAKRDNILAEATKFLAGCKEDDEVIVSFAGHGVLDKRLDYYFGTADIDFKAPEKQGLPYEAIEALMDGLAARRKLLLLDTCHSGELDKEAAPAKAALRGLDEPHFGAPSRVAGAEARRAARTAAALFESPLATIGQGRLVAGPSASPADALASRTALDGVQGAARPQNGVHMQVFPRDADEASVSVGLQNTFALMQEMFADLRQGSGTVVISAASGAGYSLESDQWNNGVFTACVLEALTAHPDITV